MKLFALAVTLLIITLSVVTASTASAKTIKVGDNWFGSASTTSITVKNKTKITFKWVGERSHNARIRKGPAKWDSGFRTKGKKSWKVKKKGNYLFVCDLHSGMDFTLRSR